MRTSLADYDVYQDIMDLQGSARQLWRMERMRARDLGLDPDYEANPYWWHMLQDAKYQMRNRPRAARADRCRPAQPTRLISPCPQATGQTPLRDPQPLDELNMGPPATSPSPAALIYQGIRRLLLPILPLTRAILARR